MLPTWGGFQQTVTAASDAGDDDDDDDDDDDVMLSTSTTTCSGSTTKSAELKCSYVSQWRQWRRQDLVQGGARNLRENNLTMTHKNIMKFVQ